MANLAPPLNTGTYRNPDYTKRVITDYVAMLDPSDAPFVEAIGGLDGASSKFKFTASGIKCEWLEDTLAPLVGALTAAVTDASVTTLGVADGNMFQPGHVLKIGDELVWVSNVSGTTLTITRGFGSTTATTHTVGVPINIVSEARLEGAVSSDLGFTNFTSDFNYSQIFERKIKLTGSAPIQDVYGFVDPYEYQAAKLMPEMMRLIELTLQEGKRTGDVQNPTTVPRAMGGVDVFLTTNITTAAVTTLSITNIENAIKLAYEDGASGQFTAIINPTDFQRITALYNNSSFIRFPPEQTRVGMVPATIVTPFGNVDFVVDRWQKVNKIYFIKPENMGMITLRPWQIKDLPADGDFTANELIGEFSFAVKLPKSMAVLNLT